MNPSNEEDQRSTIRSFVEDFYSHVRADAVLGPIFNNQIGDHWEEHFNTLTDFWMTVLHGVHIYKGNPFLGHRQTPGIQPEHFDRWLTLFAQSAERKLPPSLAEVATVKANRIAQSLRQGLFFTPTMKSPATRSQV